MSNSSQESRPSTDSVTDQKLRMEIEKLKVETENLRNSTSWSGRLAQYNSLITVGIAVIGAWVSIYQFNKQLSQQSDREFAAREQESKRRYWEEQNKIYQEACDASATIASAESLDEVKQERQKFRRLFWGTMSLVEHSEVELAMKDFEETLEKWEETESKPDDITDYSYIIAHCCRKSLQMTWRPVDIGDLEDDGCPYP